MRTALLLALLWAAPASAQWLDPDRCLTCADTWAHAGAGAGVSLGTQLVLPRAGVVRRLLIVLAIGAAWECGQASATTQRGRGYGFGLKDLAADLVGALAAEVAVAVIRQTARR
jgi:uncharacterized protein YfiM (DUF2279 family)